MKKLTKEASKYAEKMTILNLSKKALIEEAYLYAYICAIHKAIEIARSYQSFDMETSMNISSELCDLISRGELEDGIKHT